MILVPPNGAAPDKFADRFKMVPVSDPDLQVSRPPARIEHNITFVLCLGRGRKLCPLFAATSEPGVRTPTTDC